MNKVVDAPLAGVRIGIVLDDFVLGGAERQARLLGLALRDAGAYVAFWALRNDGVLRSKLQLDGFATRVLPVEMRGGWRQRARGLVTLLTVIRRERLDALLPLTANPNVACCLVWRVADVRYCWWNQRDPGLYPVHPLLESVAIRLARAVYCNSEHLVPYLARASGKGAAKICVVPNAIKLDPPLKGVEAWRHAVGCSASTLALAMVANFLPVKDHRTALLAFKELINRLPHRDLRLIFAGEDYGIRAELEWLAMSEGLADAVRFVGRVDDVSGLLEAMDIYLHTAIAEGSPNAVLEAMLAGKPVVATRSAGTADALGPLAEDWLAPAGDAQALADRLQRLESDAPLRASTGLRNQLRVRDLHDPQIVARRYVSDLRSAVRSHRLV